MGRKTTIYSILFMLAIIAGGCTQNGGHIGKIFGRWQLERIEADNMEAPEQHGTIFWAFQEDMIKMQRDDGNHEFSFRFGTYRLEDNTLFLDFPEKGNAPFKETGLGLENELQVLKLTHAEFILLYHPEPDASLTYYFKKW